MANDVVKRAIFLFSFFISVCTNPVQKCSFPMDQNSSHNGDITNCDTTKSKYIKRNCELLEQITNEICGKDDFKKELLKVKDIPTGDEDFCKELYALAAVVPFISNYSLIKDKEYCELICFDVDTESALSTWVCNNIFIGVKLIHTKTKKSKLQKLLTSDLSDNKNAVQINGDIITPETTTTTTTTTNSNSIASTVSEVLHVNPPNNAASSNDNEKPPTSGDKKETSNDAIVSTEASTKKENGVDNALSNEFGSLEKNVNENDENTKMSTESSTSTIVSSSTTTTTTTVTTPTVEVTSPTTVSTISTASSTKIVTTDTTTIPSTEKNLQKENEVNMKQTDDEPNEDTQSSDGDDDSFTGQTGEGNNHDLNYDLPTDGDQLYPPEKPVEPVEDKATSGVIMPGPEFPQYTDSHFFVYFLTAVVLCVLLYLAFHNKQKIIALIIEGRHERRRRSSNISYKKLDNNLDQVLHGTKSSAVTPAHIIY